MTVPSDKKADITDLETGSVHEPISGTESLTKEKSIEEKPSPPRQEITYIKGWRFHLISLA